MMKQTTDTGHKLLLVGLLTLLFNGCATMSPPRDNYRPTMPPAYTTVEPIGGSIYQAARDVRLFEDVKARRIGDTLTVVLQERTSASKSAKTSADKEQETTVANPTFFGASPEFNLPGLIPLDSNRDNTLEQNLRAERSFKGEADTSQSNSLSGEITVTIADVLPNGNLREVADLEPG
jgi:flagellar L-ring protein precursor FlgH